MSEKEIYKFECTSQFEKYYSEDSFYGAYNVITEQELPHSQKYEGFSMDENSSPVYFVNIAGKTQRLYIGCKYEIEATLEFSNRYNCWQYVPINIRTIKPTTLEDNKKFLLSILTENQTNTLLETYPNIVDMVMNKEEVDLSKLKGIKDKTFNKIKDKILDAYGMSDLLVMLQPLGITLKQIEKIKQLDDNTEIVKQKICENPYILTEIKGLGFKKVDGIANKINPNVRESRFRTIAFIKYFFTQLGSSKGDTLCKVSELINEASDTIPECVEILNNIIEENRVKNRLLFVKDDIIGLNKYIDTERRILDLLNFIEDMNKDYTEEVDLKKAFEISKKRLGYDFTDEQKNSIKSTLDNGAIIITAKAGCGKTTVINGILDLYKDKCKIVLCSLSAKAVRRMVESTGREAKTIHSLLGFGQSQDDVFLYNENNPLDLDILIIDEATMINAELMLALLKALKPTSKVVLVFDPEQLPPIGYGNVATDLLKSNFTICELTKVHRQALDSGILTDANMIREQKFPIKNPVAKEVHGKLGDLCYMFRNDREQIRDIAVNHFLKTIEKEGNSIENTIIITPRKDNCINSALEINKIIQDKLISKDTIGINRGDVIFRKGCRVIQRVNNKEKNVINGELGYITDIFTEVNEKDGKEKKYFTITFDKIANEETKVVTFEQSDLGDIQLGYCLTAHSVQGSEWSNVIICIDMTHYNLLSSNILYTCITRTKEKCLLTIEPSAFTLCIRKKANKRKTWLRKYIKN